MGEAHPSIDYFVAAGLGGGTSALDSSKHRFDV